MPFSVVAVFASWKMGCAGEPEGKMNVNQLHKPLLEILFEQMSLYCLYIHANSVAHRSGLVSGINYWGFFPQVLMPSHDLPSLLKGNGSQQYT